MQSGGGGSYSVYPCPHEANNSPRAWPNQDWSDVHSWSLRRYVTVDHSPPRYEERELVWNGRRTSLKEQLKLVNVHLNSIYHHHLSVQKTACHNMSPQETPIQQLHIGYLLPRMIGLDTLDSWSVLVAYSENALNELLQARHEELPPSATNIYKLDAQGKCWKKPSWMGG